jgi:hypothetical protein
VATDDLYYFTQIPEDPAYVRPYQCAGLATGERPIIWTLLGFFNRPECIAIQSDFVFEEDLCSDEILI